MKKRKSDAKGLFVIAVEKGQKARIYLKKGIYYIEQSVGEHEDKTFNNKLRFSSAGTNIGSLSVDKGFSFAGMTKKTTIYLKFKA